MENIVMLLGIQELLDELRIGKQFYGILKTWQEVVQKYKVSVILCTVNILLFYTVTKNAQLMSAWFLFVRA